VKRSIAVAASCTITLALAGCAHHSSDTLAALDALRRPIPTTTTTAPQADSDAEKECEARGWRTASLRPIEGTATGPAVSELRERGYIVVGVDETTPGFAVRKPGSPVVEGFDVELAKEIGALLLGPDADADPVRFIPVVTDTKLRLVEDHTIDMSISANSMSCDRWDRVSFSTEYYTADQAFLVPKEHPFADLAAVAGARVCVTASSSSKGILENEPAIKGVELVIEATRPECLVDIQDGTADAYFGHDSFLAGLQQIDPTTKIQYGLLPHDTTVSHYGIAIAKDRDDLVRAVNAALETIRSNGTWELLHGELERSLGIRPSAPPEAVYRD
jgi:polar amino acid transport system substrate-binding protein